MRLQKRLRTDFSRLTEIKVADEQHAWEYDELGRLVKVTQTENIPSRYGQARFGKARFSSGAATVEERTFLYDALDRLTKVTFPGAETILYEYDKEGNLTKLTDTHGKVTEYSYYNDGRLHEVIVKRTGESDRVFTYSYDVGGRLEKIVYPSETGSTSPIEARFYGPAGASTEPGWDENGNLLRLFYHRDGSRIHSFEYAYDDSSNRVSLVDTPLNTANKVTWQYTYDWLNRLAEVKKGVGAQTPVTVSLYGYDESDNRIQLDMPQLGAGETHTYTYDVADQILNRSVKIGAGATNVVETFQHDEDGNMTSRTLTAGPNTTTYTWSRFDRLVSIQRPSNDTTKNVYDAGGIRKKKTAPNASETESFYTGMATLAEVEDASGTPENVSYIRAHQLLGFEREGSFSYFLSDGLGSVRVLTNAAGVETASWEYSEGGLPSKTGSGKSTKSYIGGLGVADEFDIAGLLYMRQRWYDPTLGIFVSRDPIGFKGGLNQYVYASHNPINRVDPEGLQDGGWVQDLTEGRGTKKASKQQKLLSIDELVERVLDGEDVLCTSKKTAREVLRRTVARLREMGFRIPPNWRELAEHGPHDTDNPSRAGRRKRHFHLPNIPGIPRVHIFFSFMGGALKILDIPGHIEEGKEFYDVIMGRSEGVRSHSKVLQVPQRNWQPTFSPVLTPAGWIWVDTSGCPTTGCELKG